MNISEYKNLSKITAAYLKLDFQTEVLNQLSKSKEIKTTAFICDEYHEYVTLTDSNFFAQSREAKCINIVATQSYSSLLNTLKEPNAVKVITQNLINKLWFRTDDLLTIEEAQKAQKDGADYIGAGAVFPTATKDDAPKITKKDLLEMPPKILFDYLTTQKGSREAQNIINKMK